MHLAPRELRPVAQPDRFYDGGSDSEPPDPARAARIVLERVDHRPVEVFAMLRRVAYRDQVHGELLVPADLATFRTDLASVPALFTWLVPRTGHHLAPALVHDALVRQPQEHLGAAMDRVAADEVFRRAMRDTHVRTVRRWLVWAAVTLATIHLGSSSWSRRRHLRYRLTAYASLALIAALGTIATLDLVDVVDWLPWMGRRPWWLELTGGLAAAIVVPLLIGLSWGRFRIAGAITGIALAVLLHVTAVLAVITALYQLVERLAARQPVGTLVAGGLALLACAVFTALLVGTA